MHFLGPIPRHTLVLISFSHFCFRTPFPTPVFLPACCFLFCLPGVPSYLPPLEPLGAIISSPCTVTERGSVHSILLPKLGTPESGKRGRLQLGHHQEEALLEQQDTNPNSSSSSRTVTFQQRSRRTDQLLSSAIATQALWCPVSIYRNYKSHLHLQIYFTTKCKTDISFLTLMRD